MKSKISSLFGVLLSVGFLIRVWGIGMVCLISHPDETRDI